MKKTIIVITILLIFTSCKTDFEKEMDLLQVWPDENNIETEPTESGLYYIETVTGTGITAQIGDEVEVHYKGRLLSNDEVFDSSYERGEPSVFTVGSLIQGWNEGLTYMKEGGEAILVIPSNLAYGAYGSGTIPGYSSLIFDIELLDVTEQ